MAGPWAFEEKMPYVAAVEDPSSPAADLRWTSRHSVEIRGDVPAGRILSVQITHHAGWHATANGRPVRAWGDPLGQIAIQPDCNGPCTVELIYDGGLEMLLARIAFWTAATGGAAWIIFPFLAARLRT